METPIDIRSVTKLCNLKNALSFRLCIQISWGDIASIYFGKGFQDSVKDLLLTMDDSRTVNKDIKLNAWCSNHLCKHKQECQPSGFSIRVSSTNTHCSYDFPSHRSNGCSMKTLVFSTLVPIISFKITANASASFNFQSPISPSENITSESLIYACFVEIVSHNL